MAHKRKDTYVAGEWAKHLKPDGKREMAKAERRAAIDYIRKAKEEHIVRQDFDKAWQLREAQRLLEGLTD